MTNINNDDIEIKNSIKTSAVDKVSPVQSERVRQELPGSGKVLPENAATNQQEEPANKLEDSRKINEAVRVLNEQIQSVQRELHFSVDEDSGKTVIKVIDLSTREVIRQIPNEEALGVAKTLNEGAELKLFSSYT